MRVFVWKDGAGELHLTEENQPPVGEDWLMIGPGSLPVQGVHEEPVSEQEIPAPHPGHRG